MHTSEAGDRTSLLRQIAGRLTEIAGDRGLLRPGRFAARGAALDALDLHVLGPLEALAAAPGQAELLRRAAALQERLGRVDARLAGRIRRAIVAERVPPSRWRAIIDRYGERPDPADRAADLRYDSLDELVLRVLELGPPDGQLRELPAEMVAYQPTPARLIPAIVAAAQIAPQDLFYDLGAGLGQVPILVALLSGARAVGLEIQPAYVASARRCAAELHLDRVAFVAQDVRSADLRGGTVFYLYTPLRGAMLQSLLDSLRAVASERPIRVCCYGPCAPAVAAQPWLARLGGPAGPIQAFQSVL